MTFILPSLGGGIIASPTAPPAFANQNSVAFDGTNDFMSISSLTSCYCFSCWIKPDTTITSSSGSIGNLLGQGSLAWFGGLGGNITGDFTDELITIRPSSQKGFAYTSSSDSIPTTSWTHIAFRWEATNSQTNPGGAGYDIFKNGTKVGNAVGTSPITSPITFSTAQLGARQANGEGSFNGKIDEVGFWSSAVTESDIATMYNNGVPGDLSALSPFGWWRMGDNDGGTGTTITDQGSGSNDGTLTNGPTFSTDVPTASPAFSNQYSVAFDGTDDKMQAGDSSTIASASVFTISAWARFHVTGQVFLASGTSSGDRIYMSLFNSNVAVVVKNGGGGAARWTTSLSANTWYHIVGTVDSGTSKLFVNGVYRATTSVATLSSTAGDDLSIGIDNGNGMSGFAFDGDVDEVAIFNTALSDGGGLSIGDTAGGDIATLYNSGTPGDLSSFNPTSWWRMGDNNSSGTTITDQGSEGNDGTLVNGPTFSTDVPS